MLALRSAWDTVTDAVEFFYAYVTYTNEKEGGKWPLIAVEANLRWWDLPGHSVYMNRNDGEVRIIWESGQSVEKALLASPGF